MSTLRVQPRQVAEAVHLRSHVLAVRRQLPQHQLDDQRRLTLDVAREHAPELLLRALSPPQGNAASGTLCPSPRPAPHTAAARSVTKRKERQHAPDSPISAMSSAAAPARSRRCRPGSRRRRPPARSTFGGCRYTLMADTSGPITAGSEARSATSTTSNRSSALCRHTSWRLCCTATRRLPRPAPATRRSDAFSASPSCAQQVHERCRREVLALHRRGPSHRGAASAP